MTRLAPYLAGLLTGIFATPGGQRAMFYGESKRSVVILLNNAVRKMGGSCWSDEQIQSADPGFLSAIRDDLLPEYKRLLAEPDKQKQKQ